MRTPSFRERRRHPRNAVAARVRLTHSRHGSFEALSRDISDGGVYLTGERLPPFMPGATFQLQLLDSVNPAIVFNTRVARGDARGLALEVIDYELGGDSYSVDVLREQWNIVKQVFT